MRAYRVPLEELTQPPLANGPETCHTKSMENKGTTMLNSVDAVHFLVLDYYPQEVPLNIRTAAALDGVWELFGEPVPDYLPAGEHPTVTEEELIEWVSDYAFRPLGGGSWALVDLTDGSPYATLIPAA